jgi:hypothetical protein
MDRHYLVAALLLTASVSLPAHPTSTVRGEKGRFLISTPRNHAGLRAISQKVV